MDSQTNQEEASEPTDQEQKQQQQHTTIVPTSDMQHNNSSKKHRMSASPSPSPNILLLTPLPTSSSTTPIKNPHKRTKHHHSKHHNVKPALQTLPEEILRNITSHLSQQDAFSLLTLSHVFTKPCLHRLYRKLRFSEKYQDTFFYNLTKSENSSLISSFPLILKFFKCIYEDSMAGDMTIDGVRHIEEIHCFNYLDTGELDIHRFLTKEDLKNQLRLRQYWDVVIREMTGLKVWNLPKISLEKLNYLREEVRGQLKFVSFGLGGLGNDDSTGSDEESYSRPLEGFEDLKEITINLDNISIFPSLSLNLLSSLLSGTASQLESLELNGNLGKFDRNVEHYLRHFNFSNDVNLKSSFMKGFEVGRLVYKHGFSVPEIQTSFNEERLQGQTLGSERRLEIVHSDTENEDGNEHDQENDIEQGEIEQEQRQQDEIEEEQPEQFLEPIITNLKFAKDCFFKQFTPEFCNSGSVLWELLDTLRVLDPELQFDNLKSLSLNNFHFDDPAKDKLKLSQLSQIIDFGKISNFKLVNVYESAREGRIPYSYYLTNLESLTLIHFDTLTEGIDLTPSNTLPFSSIDDQFPTLDSLLTSNTSLEYLSVFGFSNALTLKSFIKILPQYQSRQTLKEVHFTNPQESLILMRKLINLQSFKQLSRFGDLTKIDDLSFQAYKKLIEILNRFLRIENYHDKGKDKDGWGEFAGEMRYLFEEDVDKVWKSCLNLEKFVYFGFVFERPQGI